MSDGFDTADRAAKAALKAAVPLSKKYEYAGIIYEQAGKFYFTEPKTSRGEEDVKIKVQYPKGSVLRGLYHTHPKGPKSELFTNDDIRIAQQLKLPYYMGHVADETFNVFRPGQSEISGRGTSPGTRLGALFGDESPKIIAKKNGKYVLPTVPQ